MAKKQDTVILSYLVTSAVVNSVVVYLASMFFPDSVVLGTSTIPPLLAAVIGGVLLTLVGSFIDALVRQSNIKVPDERVWGAIYGVINIVSVWLIARGAVYTGMGITSLWVAVVLGVVLTLVQWGIWKMMLGKK